MRAEISAECNRADAAQQEVSNHQHEILAERSLANDPKLLLADEPTGNLDSTNAGRIIELLLQLREQQKMTLVIVTHDLGVAGRTDRIVRMLDGRVVADGPSS